MRTSLRLIARRMRQCLLDFKQDIQLELRHGRDLRRFAAGKRGILLHVGCGPNVLDGWLNVDVNPCRSGVFYLNAVNGLPLADQSVRRIHCEHFLEHLTFGDAVSFLTECKRVLEPDGTLRVIVPDAAIYMRGYAADDKALFDKLDRLGNSMAPLETKGIICNQMFRMGGGHQFAWDFETLEHVSRQVGFTAVSRSRWCDPQDKYQVDGKEDWRPVESLYAEIRK